MKQQTACSPRRKGLAVRSGQQFASQLLKQLQDDVAADGAPQRAAMLATEQRMARLGMETYWQLFGGSSGGASAEAAEQPWGFAANNNTGVGGPRSPGSSSGAQPGAGGAQSARRCANLHGVLRSPRGDGKEALVLVTPLALAARHQHPGTKRLVRGIQRI